MREGRDYHFVAISAEQDIQGVVKRLSSPTTNYFLFPAQAAFFRMFYKSEDNGVTAIVIAGTTREDLDRRTKAVGSDVASCEKSLGMCVALPKIVGVNPFLVVKVNGSATAVQQGATISGAIEAAGVNNPETVLPQLSVTRLFGEKPTPMKFNRKSREILGLELIVGDQISWQAPHN